MCVESLPRKPHVVTFDNALLALKLAPAARGQGAVLDGWTDPIGVHDLKVIEVEQAMLQEKELVSNIKYCNRVEKNWMVAMSLLNEHPHKLEEYVLLKFEMKTFEKRFARATVLTEKLELQSMWEKFCAMEPVLAAKEQYELVKVDREQAQTDVLAHGRVIAKLKREEVEAAEKITDDHVEACDRGKSLGDIFPSIRVGYIITKLFGRVDVRLGDLPFEEVLRELKAAPRPHTLELLRYDMNFNRLTLKWETLEEVRQQGKYVRDAREERLYFVKACGEGDIDRLQARLARGEDVESTDLEGNTGMHVAAATSGLDVINFLLDNKADKEARNRNMETPLLVAARRGATASVRFLLQKDAKMDVMDRARRTPLMHAILSESEAMAAVFMDYSVALRATDIQWGWTALHCAAHVGMTKVAETLLGKRASPYAESKIGQTPLDVARRARQVKTAALLEAFLRAEPAHEVIVEAGANIWQGSHAAAHPVWASDQGFECILTIADPRFPDKKLGWLDDDGDVDHLRVEAEVDEDDLSSRPWNNIAQHTRIMVSFLNKAVRRRKKILVHCRHGSSTSAAVITAYRLLKHGIGVRNTLSAIAWARGDSMNLSPAMATGLQKLQEDFAKEKEKRLVERARMAPILSLGF
ncbi:unnamed protein product [Pylaiella littoralis]